MAALRSAAAGVSLAGPVASIAGEDCRAPGVGLADWKSRSDGHPEWFVADGVHLTPAGRLAYAALVSEAIG